MVFTKQYLWTSPTTQNKLITLNIPNAISQEPSVTVHPCTLTLAETAELAEASRAAAQIGSGFHTQLTPQAKN